jgi:Leucine-rich repeat (LRR) protein
MLTAITHEIILNILITYLDTIDFSRLLCVNKYFNNNYKSNFVCYINQDTNIINNNINILHTLKFDRNHINIDYDVLNILSLKYIYNVDFNECSYVKDVRCFLNTKIINCNLRKCYLIKDLYGLSDTIINLNLSDCSQLSILYNLKDLKNLVNLNLNGCYKIDDLSPLSNLKDLVSLDIGMCYKIKEISVLSNPTNLVNLNLSGLHQIKDLTPLSNLKKLVTLDLSGCYHIKTDLSTLTNLTNLVNLDIRGCAISRRYFSFRKLSNFTSLVNFKR